MAQTAKLFMNGNSQAVRLPKGCRFEETEVYVRRDEATGDVILSRRPQSLATFLAFANQLDIAVPADFLGPDERQTGLEDRDPLAGAGGA
jgi:antitoxin VapB